MKKYRIDYHSKGSVTVDADKYELTDGVFVFEAANSIVHSVDMKEVKEIKETTTVNENNAKYDGATALYS